MAKWLPRELVQVQQEWPIAQVIEALRMALNGQGPALAFGPTTHSHVSRKTAVVIPSSGSAGEPKEVALTSKALMASAKAAHKYLKGLKGLEIGGSAHNPFGLDTLNVDITDSLETVFKQQEIELCGEALKVDIIASGDNIPVEDKSFDFVISSHVIEHFKNPIIALKEWQRIAKKYIFIICSHKERTFDKDRELTNLFKLFHTPKMFLAECKENENGHYTVWNLNTFLAMLIKLGLKIEYANNIDDKVGNGFMVLIDVSE